MSDYLNENKDFKSDRINFEATLYKGCTLNELLILVIISFGSLITLFLVIFSMLFDQALLGVAFAIPCAFGLMLMLANILGGFKQNKPQGYYQMKIALWLEDIGIKKTPYVRRSGVWSLRRIK